MAQKVFDSKHIGASARICGGPAERSWGGVKQVNDEKMSHLSGKSTEKRISILFDLLKISHA
jgi:hypothetical protein